MNNDYEALLTLFSKGEITFEEFSARAKKIGLSKEQQR